MHLLNKNNFTDFITTQPNSGEFGCITHNGFTVVLFSWDLCKPCLGVKQQLKPLAQQIPCAVVEVSENIQLADRYKITGFPTLLLFKNGVEVDRRKGYFTTAQLREWLKL